MRRALDVFVRSEALKLAGRRDIQSRHLSQMASLSPPVAEGLGSGASTKLSEAGFQVELVPCLSDNYCPIIHHASSNSTIIMDSPDAAPIISRLKTKGWILTHILNTHHHEDHVGGNGELKRAYPAVQIFGPHRRNFEYPGPYPPPGPQEEVIPFIDAAVKEGDAVQCGELRGEVINVPGHTDGHIAYFFPSVPFLFAGDALFTMGCGRVFTGDFLRMRASLAKLRSLPDETVVYGGHEYTASNAKFARQVEPNNAAVLERETQIAWMRENSLPTVPTLLGHEKITNPFLRWDVQEVKAAVGLVEPDDVFTAVRRWKDTGNRPQTSKM